MEENKEEQEMEVLALKSIYEDEFKILEGDGEEDGIPITKFEIEIASEIIETIRILLRIEYVDEYPSNSPPRYTLEVVSGVSGEQISELREKLDELADELSGGVVAFEFVSLIQEQLDIYAEEENEEIDMLENNNNNNNNDNVEDENILKFDAEKKRKADTLVTREIFLEWRENFENNVIPTLPIENRTPITRNLAISNNNNNSNKLTGRELFDKNAKLFEDKEAT
eukprot:TRINITY_DN34_c0_g1_i2.p1 TRINITY_DN34_c0_g1~~TRINITY_DN34_c0_g1_i2.p1  ORF type:complete len:226 (-),score=91.83 TRINITY_DN34_c0_g1_i2:85-762(-)